MKRTIKEMELAGKKVLLRVDFNVPLNEDGAIADDKRIVETLPTIRYLLKQGSAVIACSHLGRPKGVTPKLSLAPVAKKLEELLGQKVIFASDVAGVDSTAKAKALKGGEIMLLENLRFEEGEEKNDAALCKKLAALADIYVNDAFGTAHRAHASTVGVAKLLPSAVGFLMSREVETITGILESPARPFAAVLGGAKVADKIGVIDAFLEMADLIILGGGMANSFLKAMGGSVGNSLCDDTKLDYCKEVLARAEEKGVRFVLPLDLACGKKFDKNEKRKVFESMNIPADYMALDIGPKTIKLYKKALKNVKTVVWNGTVGVAEWKQFAVGTNKLAKIVSKLKNATTVIGGGDTASAVVASGYGSKMTHISTGGGATLELIEGKVLPGVEVIENI